MINPPPFPLERRKYLAGEIQPFVSSEVPKDILCPVPSDVQDETDTPKKPPVCAYCKQEGHRNQVRNGVPLCHKRIRLALCLSDYWYFYDFECFSCTAMLELTDV